MRCAQIGLLMLLPACVTVSGDTKTDTGGDPGTDLVPAEPTTTIPKDPDGDLDGYPASTDCDDANPAINPGAVEACDGIDNNCDNGIDDLLAATVEGVGSYATVDEAVTAVMIPAPTGSGVIEQVADGAITLCPGSWTVAPIAFVQGSLTLRSVTGRDATTLVSATGGGIATVDEGGTLTIEGLTLTGAIGTAISVYGDSTVSISASRITANGQGLYVLGEDRQGGDVVGATVLLDGVDIDGNIGGADGGGAAIQGAFAATLTNVSFTGNSGRSGGGLYLATLFGPADLTLTNVQIIDNVASSDGGGVYTELVPFVGDATTQIVGNTAGDHGGGVAAKRATVSDVLLSGNDASYGGGLAALYDPFLSTAPNPGEAENLIVDANGADEGGGLWIGENEYLSLRSSCKVTLNDASVRGGGAMLAGDDSYLVSDFADFGAPGVNDNTPDDLYVAGYGALLFGDDAAFACSTVTFCD